MKRYDLEETSYSGRGEYSMVEDPEGEWVRWKDVEPCWTLYETVVKMNPIEFADFLNALSKGKIKCEGIWYTK